MKISLRPILCIVLASILSFSFSEAVYAQRRGGRPQRSSQSRQRSGRRSAPNRSSTQNRGNISRPSQPSRSSSSPSRSSNRPSSPPSRSSRPSNPNRPSRSSNPSRPSGNNTRHNLQDRGNLNRSPADRPSRLPASRDGQRPGGQRPSDRLGAGDRVTRSEGRTNISNRPEVQNDLRNRRSNISASPDNRNINIDNRRDIDIDIDGRGGGGTVADGTVAATTLLLVGGWWGSRRGWPLALLSALPRPITRRSTLAAPVTFIPMEYTWCPKTTPTSWLNRPPALW